ncbi:recombinase family protein [Desulfuromusa kysingii]|uniref:recombinase family protein n=1 Tax=Desulfuromusa kysingii TaxID=37625 RepID=UPI003CCBB730
MNVALYARVSTTKQAEKDLSIPDQLGQMRSWCKRQGYSVTGEYTEPGASATDDRRPVFQKMIADACVKPSPFNVIIIHSFSRFFRDSFLSAYYKRKLKKYGIKVISITQQTTDDPNGQLFEQMLSIFDEHQSNENSKHTLRAMKENARQGFFNGAKPPYGYKAVETEHPGRNGKKKKLQIDDKESVIVTKIFRMYLHGHRGQTLGGSGIACHLNNQGETHRGKKWSSATILHILKNSAYHGEYYFNKFDTKAKETKPKEEWVLTPIPSIIERDDFERVQKLIAERAPSKTPPRVTNSPTLLTGLLKCTCGASMTIATGKGGKYRYYKCTTRINQDKHACKNPNIPVETLDRFILESVSEKIFSRARVSEMLKMLQSQLKESKSKHDTTLMALKKELAQIEESLSRLYDAVEKGQITLDETLKERTQNRQFKRREILAEMARTIKESESELDQLGPKNVDLFRKSLKTKLMDSSSNFGKNYLKLLIKEIVVDGKEVRITGSYAALVGALEKTKAGNSPGVPTFGVVWLPLLGSNQRQSD